MLGFKRLRLLLVDLTVAMEESALWAGNGAGNNKYPEATTAKRKRPPQNLNSCNMCVRYILIVSNCIFFVSASHVFPNRWVVQCVWLPGWGCLHDPHISPPM